MSLYRFSKIFPFVAAAGAALLFNLSLPPYDLRVLLFVALLPLLWALEYVDTQKERCAIAYLFGFLSLLWQFSWALELAPLGWFGISSAFLGWTLAFLGWIIFSAGMAVPALLLGVRVPYIFFPLLWFGYEALRSSVMQWVIFYGSGSSFGLNFLLGNFGYAFHGSWILEHIGPFVSVLTLSLILVLVTTLFWARLRTLSFEHSFLQIILIFLLAAFMGIVVAVPAPQPPPQIGITGAVFTGDNYPAFTYSSGYFESVRSKYLQLLRHVSPHQGGIIFAFPENSRVLGSGIKGDFAHRETLFLSQIASATPAVLVYGGYDSGEKKALAVIALTAGDHLYKEFILEKKFLMPFGEYAPWYVQGIAKLLGFSEWYERLSGGRGSRSGNDGVSPVVETPFGRIAVFSCSEIFSDAVYSGAQNADLVAIIHMQRLALFTPLIAGNDTKIYKMSLALSQIRAAQTRTIILGAVDGGGKSYIIWPNGSFEISEKPLFLREI